MSISKTGSIHHGTLKDTINELHGTKGAKMVSSV